METLHEQVRTAARDVFSRDIDLCNDPVLGDTLAYADKAHQRCTATDSMQWRKYLTHVPYIVHPVRVSNIVRIAGGTIVQQKAALLHDTVEDTYTTIEDIYAYFGKEVGNMVAGLTDVSGPPVPGRNRALRKAEDREHSAAQPGATQTVKYADLIDNGYDIAYYDSNFARVYFKEKALLLDMMDKGCPNLREVAYQVLKEGMLLSARRDK